MTTDVGPGTRVGAYILDEPIGRGGFATIWRGHHHETEEAVAVKVMSSGPSNSDRSVQRAEIELLAGAAVRRSAHAVQVLDGGVRPFPFLVMEYVEGTDFAEALRREGTFSPERTIEIGLAILDALAAMNEAGIIHRDLKPANVMLSDTGVIKLTDFGIAKIIGYETITVAGEVALTMAYAAPEVWDGGDGPYGPPCHQSDLYALAIMLFEFLTGSTPFRGGHMTLFRSHREQRPNLAKLPLETPASLRVLLDKCLEKNPKDRPRDATLCSQMLQRARIELLEAQGQPLREPRHFGPWERLRPHPTQPWAWLCKRGEELATVEVHFSRDADVGTHLRRAVAANPSLTGLGAERLIETNRLLLRPGEEWAEALPGQFQFWVARKEEALETEIAKVTAAELGPIASGMINLIEAATRQDLVLCFASEDVSVFEGGRIHLRRPGLAPATTNMEESALACLTSLPIDARARALLSTATALQDLAGAMGTKQNQATQVVSSGGSPATVVVDWAPRRTLACSRCGDSLLDSDAFCGNCGQPNRPPTPKCSQCGTAYISGDAFCGNCGGSLR